MINSSCRRGPNADHIGLYMPKLLFQYTFLDFFVVAVSIFTVITNWEFSFQGSAEKAQVQVRERNELS